MMFLCLLLSEEKSFTAEFFCLADCSNNFGAVIAGFNGNKESEKSTASKFLTHLGLEKPGVTKTKTLENEDLRPKTRLSFRDYEN